MKNSENKASRPSQVTQTFRLMIGMYLLYLAYGLIKDVGQFSGKWLILGYMCIFIFAVAGIIITGLSLKYLIKGKNPESEDNESKDNESKDIEIEDNESEDESQDEKMD